MNTEKFWDRIVCGKPDQCWPWRRYEGTNKYAHARVNGRTGPAHRHAWELHNRREMGPGMLACHHCDNPPCCNPEHIFEGTPAANNRDAREKGRIPAPYMGRTPAQEWSFREMERRNRAAFAYAKSQGRI